MENPQLPMRFLKDAWDELSERDRARAELVAGWDLNFITADQLVRLGLQPRDWDDEAKFELKRFLTIKVLRDPHPLGCFGQIVAAVWHAFILDTQRYAEFCDKSYGKLIHHKPNNYGEGVADNAIWISIYHEWFGLFPAVWKIDLVGMEVPGVEHAMNVEGQVSSANMDSDDGAY
ncbi:hypothetical protein [Rhizobium leguminosarum]|uniref:hypothetical protein n=1 Tax=Rhizobium leguminosarum TaxID=384 RepID=UPI0010315B4D|nr:hypothetical protein [Rhizobium leguminosarum]TBF80817.1 hypothetical protein ELG86_01040 [Rhizobium leguminosarum]